MRHPLDFNCLTCTYTGVTYYAMSAAAGENE